VRLFGCNDITEQSDAGLIAVRELDDDDLETRNHCGSRARDRT
jgi:hypothetical protein